MSNSVVKNAIQGINTKFLYFTVSRYYRHCGQHIVNRIVLCYELLCDSLLKFLGLKQDCFGRQ